jgi:putative ABC transport system ATP-binding protein
METLITPPTYELRAVTRRYGAGNAAVEAVRDLSVRIDTGEFVAIVGPSGSGKTTLLQLLGALDRPSSGEIFFEGRELGRLGETELTRLRLAAIGFVFQQFNLIPTLTAAQNVGLALAPRSLSRDERETRVGELLAAVGLAARGGHLPGQLSGGEQQRVAIARALANEPRVLLADEPTGNLDSTTGDEIVSLLRRLSTERAVTTVLVTHDGDVAAAAERTIRMQDGRVVEPDAAAAVVAAAGVA